MSIRTGFLTLSLVCLIHASFDWMSRESPGCGRVSSGWLLCLNRLSGFSCVRRLFGCLALDSLSGRRHQASCCAHAAVLGVTGLGFCVRSHTVFCARVAQLGVECTSLGWMSRQTVSLARYLICYRTVTGVVQNKTDLLFSWK